MPKNNTVFDCSVIEFAKIHNEAGNITVLDNRNKTTFNINRIYYLYDIPGGQSRGGHAHYELEQYIVAASGSFDIIIDDGRNRKRVTLNRPNYALHIVPGLWRELDNFSSGSICLVLASHKYDKDDYMHNYTQFLNFKK